MGDSMKKVLLIDDDPGIIEVLKLYFEKEGYSTSVCMQGDKAIAAFNVSRPDIIILDLMLPGMDGYDICKEIRKTSDVPIIMLTARTDTLDKVVGLELGADDYVQKPFEPKELLARVKAVLRRTGRSEASPEKKEEESVETGSEVISYPGFSVDKVKYVDNANQELDALGQTDLRHEAVADKQFQQVLGEAVPQDSTSTVELTAYEPNQLTYSVESKKGGVLVFSEIYYPGWTATVDGEEVELGRVNYVLRAMPVTAGHHEVVLSFFPKSLDTTETLAYVALTLILLCVVALIVMQIRRKPKA
jgi:DNA-binding response OmpR family regulator